MRLTLLLALTIGIAYGQEFPLNPMWQSLRKADTPAEIEAIFGDSFGPGGSMQIWFQNAEPRSSDRELRDTIRLLCTRPAVGTPGRIEKFGEHKRTPISLRPSPALVSFAQACGW